MAFAFYSYGAHFLTTILVISFLVFFHELGHFSVARILGVNVQVFSIGFGERLCGWRFGNTEYRLSAIPLGGYVQLKGQSDTDPAHKNFDPDSYNTLSPFKRILILFAGPFFNFVLAFLIYLVLAFGGVSKLAPTVGEILPESAASGVLQKGDVVLSVDGASVKEWSDIGKNVKQSEMKLVVKRGNETLNLNLTPKVGESKNVFGESVKKPLIGITPNGDVVKVGFDGTETLAFAWSETKTAATLIAQSVPKLIFGDVPVKEMGGIVAIADITTKAAKVSFETVLLLAALISVNLGVLNLLPLPVLDGGHIVFNLYEMLFRREVNERVRVVLTYVSMAILLTFMVFTVFNDLLRIGGYYG